MAGRSGSGLVRAVAPRLLRSRLDSVPVDRLSWRRATSRCARDMDAGTKLRLGLRQASAVDGVDNGGLDVHLSTGRLVVATDGDDERGLGAMVCRPHFKALGSRGQ